MDYFDRKTVSIHIDEGLNEAEAILTQTGTTIVRELPFSTFQKHEKQSSDDGGEQLTNQSDDQVQRERELAGYE